MKTFTIIKTGYSCGNTGCTNEYLTCIYTRKGKFESFKFKGMYGADERVEVAFKNKGYTFNYVNSSYGQLKGEDRIHAEKFSLYEQGAIKFVIGTFKPLA